MKRLGCPISKVEYGRLLEPLLEQAAGYSFSLLRQRSDAEDAVQQAALRGLQSLDTYEASRSFKGWWFTVLKHCCYDILRERRTRPVRALDALPPQIESKGETRGCEELLKALEQLSPEHEEILRLKYFGGMKYHEIAQTLGIPEGTVMSRLHLARNALAMAINVEVL
jgi:RNA polymerase sigma-70 factor (ECF subfamily)